VDHKTKTAEKREKWLKLSRFGALKRGKKKRFKGRQNHLQRFRRSLHRRDFILS
jgi:hypothetical protein